jgi:hypothetical protein
LLVRQAGWERTRLLITAPLLGAGTGAAPAGDPLRLATRDDDVSRVPAVSEDALRTLREEIQGELLRAAGLTREFDARLTRMEAVYAEASSTPKQLEASIQEIDARNAEVVDAVRRELAMVQRTASTYGERRITAVSELYANLAKVEAALGSVVNPALLPGEPLSLPDELGNDAFEWANWRDVGDRAYTFGTTFNQHRYVLDDEVAQAVESFIATLRQELTGTVYPNVQTTPSAEQRARVRTGLESIVTALPVIRKHLETVYRADMVR